MDKGNDKTSDGNSPSEVFDSVLYRGFKLASDDEMMPESLGSISAISADVTESWAEIGRKQYDGQSLQVRYGKNIQDTGTNIKIAGYRYSTDGFYTLSEALDSYRRNSHGNIQLLNGSATRPK